MNLLAKIWTGSLIFTSLFIFSCEDPSDIGLELDPNALSTEVIFKELTLTANNVYNDSLRTSNTARLLVGRTESDIFGTTVSSALVQLATGNTSLRALVHNIQTTVLTNPAGVRIDTIALQHYVYDSAVLTLEFDYVNTASDISTPQTLSLHQLGDQLASGVYYLSKFDTPYLPNDPEDEFEFVIDADSLSDALEEPLDSPFYVLKRKLSNTVGNTLYEIVKNARTQENLLYDFKGVALVPGEENTAMVGFNAAGSSNIIVHYHINEVNVETGAETVAQDGLGVVFSFSGSNARYNKIDVDRSGSLIGNNIGSNLESFDTGDDMVYLNPASGIYPKISLQPILDFFEQYDQENGEYIQISRAELRINDDLNEGDYSPNVTNIRFLFMNEGKQVNTSGLLLANDLRSTIVLTDAGYLGGDPRNTLVSAYNSDSLDYRAPMTFFIQQAIRGEVYAGIDNEGNRIPLESIALMPTDLNITNYSAFNTSDIKIRLYYALTNQ